MDVSGAQAQCPGVRFGKAVIGMAAAVETLFGEHVIEGAVSIPTGTVATMRANHPEFLPSS